MNVLYNFKSGHTFGYYERLSRSRYQWHRVDLVHSSVQSAHLQPVCVLKTFPPFQPLLDVPLPDVLDRQLTLKPNYPDHHEIFTSDSNPHRLTSCPVRQRLTGRQPKMTPHPSLSFLLASLSLFPVLLMGTNPRLSHWPGTGLVFFCVVQYFIYF